MRTFSPADLVHTIAKRRWFIIIPFALGLAAVPLLERVQPERYRSETLIVVIPQRVPDSYVKATVTEDIEDRLPSISEQILSRSRLEAIINELNLYPERRRSQVMEDVVQRMRSDVNVGIVGSGEDADSFRISYVSNSPETARKVTERLASNVIEQNLRDRENQADSTNQFLETQLQEAKQRLVEQERKLEEYRKLHAGELPTQLQGNLQSIQNANLQLQQLSEGMNRAMEKRLLIERQIADSESLNVAQMTTTLGPSGPVLPASNSQRLELARSRLTTLLQYYTPDHPEVLTAQRQVRDLEAVVATEVPVSDDDKPSRALSPTEAAQRRRVMDLKAEMLVVDKQLESSRGEEGRLRRLIGALQSKVDALPSRESELVELTRDYSTLQAAYSSLLLKREDSAIAADLERRQIGEQFRILDPASMPERPFNQMQRVGIMGSGALAGLFLGLVIVGILEFRDSSFHGEEEVEGKLSLPVLALIPIMSSPRERQAARRKQRLIDVVGFCILLAAVVTVVVWRVRF
jgi:polysaccharide chain length determinant protein (PEP-CTERM system associated)